MRWEALFDDLEGRLEAEEAAELAGEVAERTRVELASVSWLDRVRGASASTVALTLLDGSAVHGTLVEGAPEWLLLRGAEGQTLVPVASVASVAGLSRRVGVAGRPLAGRVTLRQALRALARDRTPVTLRLVGGLVLVGTVDRVGLDYVDLAEHDADQPRRASAVTGVRTVPLPAVLVIRDR